MANNLISSLPEVSAPAWSSLDWTTLRKSGEVTFDGGLRLILLGNPCMAEASKTLTVETIAGMDIS